MSHRKSHTSSSAPSSEFVSEELEPRDVVIEASMDSFPASDPPGWIRSRATGHAEAPEPVNFVDLSDAETDATAGPSLRRAKRIAIGVAIGAAVLGGAFAVRKFIASRA